MIYVDGRKAEYNYYKKKKDKGQVQYSWFLYKRSQDRVITTKYSYNEILITMVPFKTMTYNIDLIHIKKKLISILLPRVLD